jgi:hypothetical protein
MTEFLTEHIALLNNNAYTFKSNKGESTVSTVKIETVNASGEVASWGANNKYPQELMDDIRKSGVVGSALRVLKNTHYGNGMVLTKDNYEGGKKSVDLISVKDYPEIKEFFKRNQWKRFNREVINDLETFWIAFPEFVLSNNKKKINRVRRQRAPWCRFEVMDDNGMVNNVWLSEQWNKGSVTGEDVYLKKIPVIDSYWSAEEVKEYCLAKNITNFIRPVFFAMTEEPYYPKVDWHAVKENGWLEVVNNIPKYKNALFKNQVSIKYLIEIDERYFERLYGDKWDDFKPEERQEKRKEVIDAINDHLTKPENAGKSIQSMKFIDENDLPQSAVTITEIGDKFKKDGAYLPEASAGNSEILFAMGVDPTIIGAGIPGGKLGAGSGSDKREAFLILSALFKTKRETTLEIFEFIQDFNGWDPDIIPMFENTVLTTLDKNPTGTQNMSA